MTTPHEEVMVSGTLHTMAFKSCSRPKEIWAVLLLFAMLTGCVQTNKISMQATARARTTAMDGVERVAVVPAEGSSAAEAAATIESMVIDSASSKQSATVTTLVDRQTLDHLRKEFKLARDNEIDRKKLTRAAQLLGADAFLFLKAQPVKVSKKTESYQTTECESYGKEKGFLGLPKCAQSKQVKVTCTDTLAHVDIQPRLVQVASGKIVYATARTGLVHYRHCDNGGTAPSEELLRAAAANNAAVEIGRDLVAHRYTVEATFKEMPEGVSPGARERFSGAIAFAKTGRFQRACEIFRGLNAQGESGMAILYNIAICEEGEGSLTSAYAMMSELDQSLMTPDKDINEAMLRLKRRLCEQSDPRCKPPVG